MIQDEELRALILALRGENEKLRQEAIIHAQEARTQRATVHECYEAVTGKTGEPADWNGAQPVREYITALRSRVEELERVLGHIVSWSHVHGKELCPKRGCDTYGEGVRETKEGLLCLIKNLYPPMQPEARAALTPDSRDAMRKGEKDG